MRRLTDLHHTVADTRIIEAGGVVLFAMTYEAAIALAEKLEEPRTDNGFTDDAKVLRECVERGRTLIALLGPEPQGQVPLLL